MYEKDVIDHLFPEHESLISMDYFKERIIRQDDEGNRATWVFDPKELR